MKNYFKYILITTIFMFIGFIGVDAESKTCVYNYNGVDSAGSSKATVIIDENANVSATLQMFAGDSYKDKKLNFTTAWKNNMKQQYLDNGNCPNFALIIKPKLFTSYSVSWHIIVSYDRNYLDNIWNSLKNAAVIIPSTEAVSSSDEETQKCRSLLAEYTEEATSQSEFEYTTEGCRDVTTGKKYTAYKECTSLASGMLSVSKGHYLEIQKCVSNGFLPENDSSVQSYYSIYKDAKENLEKFQEEVEDEKDYYIENGRVKNNNRTSTDYSCEDMSNTMQLLKKIYTLLRYLIPIIIIGLSIVDFIKVVANGEDKVFKEVWTKFVKRLIIGIVILIIPMILQFLIHISGVAGMYDLNEDNIFCIFS